MMEMAGETLVDVLRARAVQQPDRLAYSFLPNGEAEEASLTYAELDLRARAIGAWLSSVSAAGDRVLLLSSSGPEFVSAVFGCLYRGAVAVPAYPLDPARIGRTFSRLSRLLKDAEPVVALTTESSLRLVEDLIRIHPDLERVRWMATESIPLELAVDWKRPPIHAETLAILQYTSGSLAAPKGVMVSHRNVLENEKMLQDAHDYTGDNTFVGWIPLAHDWGLINNVFQPLYSGALSVLMPPEVFLQKPVRWLQTISRYKNVTSGGPGFAYELCVAKISSEEREGLHLGNWMCAGIGASPVRPATLDRFAAKFSDCGFRRQAFYCGYGLAEATLLVTDSEKFKEPRVLRVGRASLERNEVSIDPPKDVPANSMVSCGKAACGEKVVIVDARSDAMCPAGRVGEIWVSGPNITQGYWNNPVETDSTFRAFLDSGEGPFLRTGDLGFLDDGELFVTGRLKDLIIIRGRNLYPEDIELSVERCHKGLRPGCTVAFSVPDEFDEGLVIVQEVRASHQAALEEIIHAIRQSILQDHEVTAHTVVLVKERSISKTSSGKLQRSACRSAFLSGALEILGQSTLAGDRNESRIGFVPPRTPTEKKLAKIWCEILNVKQIGIHDRFFDVGGDSLAATQCLARIAQEFGVEQFTRETFLYAPTLGEMARAISDPAKWVGHENEVLPLQSNNGSGVPLILVFPGTEYAGLVRHLGPDRDVLGIRDIGIDRLPAPRTIEQIATECVRRVRRHVPTGPYALAGWCASGIVALEVGRKLEEEGEEVAFVAIFDARDIFLPPMNQFRRRLVRSWRFAQRIVFFGSEVRSLWRRAANWNAGVRKAARRFQELAGDPSGILVLALQQYRPKPWSGRTIHLWAAERPKGVFRGPEFVWGHLSPAGFEFHEVPGDHDSMLREPNAKTIAEILGRELSEAGTTAEKMPTEMLKESNGYRSR
jgi:acyl-CoA synthetase (AMP-forming)/AMP-acid ligase II/thioesterase domain-containing protein/acyl carrier protein